MPFDDRGCEEKEKPSDQTSGLVVSYIYTAMTCKCGQLIFSFENVNKETNRETYWKCYQSGHFEGRNTTVEKR